MLSVKKSGDATSMHLAVCDYALARRCLMHGTTGIGTILF
jgi:hypothetical protein